MRRMTEKLTRTISRLSFGCQFVGDGPVTGEQRVVQTIQKDEWDLVFLPVALRNRTDGDAYNQNPNIEAIRL